MRSFVPPKGRNHDSFRWQVISLKKHDTDLPYGKLRRKVTEIVLRVTSNSRRVLKTSIVHT